MRETKEELQDVTVFQASAIIPKEWKKVITTIRSKVRDLYKVKKQQYEEALQRYQENQMDEVDVISLHKRFNKTDANAAATANK